MKKIKRVLPIILSALLLTACAPGNSLGYKQITMSEAVKMMETEKNYIILDVRRADEFAEGHIPGAINVANEVIGTEDNAKNALVCFQKAELFLYDMVADGEWMYRKSLEDAIEGQAKSREKLNDSLNGEAYEKYGYHGILDVNPTMVFEHVLTKHLSSVYKLVFEDLF